ncbi:hypothetical protein [Methylocapsa aurea]|uniref:hypothetical protein n=1 Tax=Methylocapsa aurea TaxID=663610 RepID=UPI003D18B23B
MCSIFGIESNWWSVTGLAADFIGVMLLGYDLVRVQRLLRENAIAERDYFNDMVEKYGGVESWTEQIKKDARWIRSAEYEDYHAEDEISYNAKQGIETLSDLAESIHALAKHVSEIVSLSEKKLNSDSTTASASLLLSYMGLCFILLGFFGQLIGSWPCR